MVSLVFQLKPKKLHKLDVILYWRPVGSKYIFVLCFVGFCIAIEEFFEKAKAKEKEEGQRL